MNLITQHAASKLEYAPSRAYLSKICNKPNRPAYFIPKEDHVFIDTDSSAWKEMIKTRMLNRATCSTTGGDGSAIKAKAKKRATGKTKKPVAKKTVSEKKDLFDDSESTRLTESDMGDIEKMSIRSAMAKVEKAELEVSKLRWENMRKKIQVEKETKDLVEFSFAEYYFFSYLDKVNSGMLRLPKKLKPQIVNFCLEKDHEGLLKYLQKEIEVTLKEVKRQQKKGLEEMKEEELQNA